MHPLGADKEFYMPALIYKNLIFVTVLKSEYKENERPPINLAQIIRDLSGVKKNCINLFFYYFKYDYLLMISFLPGPLDTIVIGTSSSFSMNSMYFLQFSGSPYIS